MIEVGALVVSLCRPVSQGWLTLEQAEAAVALAVLRAARAGRLPGRGDPAEAIELWCKILRMHMTALDERREVAAVAIERVMWPLVNRGEAPERVRAEAHDANSDTGKQFGEAEIEALFIDLLQRRRAQVQNQTRPPARPRRFRHGR